jgi:ADP-L-glycero-D-manno-heptose 6-epimerase
LSRPIALVTGGAGFIGSNLVARLCEAGAWDVVVCDWLGRASEERWRNLAKHPIADLVAAADLFACLERMRADVALVVHMGAISSTTEDDVDLVARTNFGLSRDLWRWCAGAGARLIYASSAATYGDGALGFSDDPDPRALAALRPLNAYGWSKALFDLYAQREGARGAAPPQWAGLKFFNVYGPNEGHKGSMKSVAAQLWPDVAAGRPVRLFKSYRDGVADGGQRRDFVYVRDVADVVAWLVAHPGVNGLFNVGSGRARSFKDLAEAVFAAAGEAPRIEYVEMPEAIRARYQYFTEADLTRLRAAGYDGQFTPLEDGIGDYVRGFLSQPDPYR